MSNANRDYAIVYDVKNSALVSSRPLTFYITDKNTSNIFIRLVTKITTGDGIDKYTNLEIASNYAVTMRVIKPNNEVKSLEATQHEPESIFQFDLTEDFKDIPGKYICELTISTIVNSRQELITSDPFNYEVKRSILSNVDEIIETEDTTVEKLLNELEVTKVELSLQVKGKVNKTKLQIKSAKMTGAGDCQLLITNNGTAILCDTGDTSKQDEVDAFLEKHIERLDYIIITHYHGDHVGNLQYIINKYAKSETIIILPAEPDFKRMNVNGDQFSTKTQEVYAICDNAGLTKKIPTEGEVFKIDDLEFKFMNCSLGMFDNYYSEVSEWAVNGETDYNNFSLVFEVKHGSNIILFTGDINVRAQENLTPFLRKCNLLKCQHHSVDTKFSANFILRVFPDMAFSNNNGQSSLRKSEITRFLLSRGIPYYVTEQSGDIEIVSDGINMICNNKSYFVGMNQKHFFTSNGVVNYMYYGFADISSRYDTDDNFTLEEAIDIMEIGSIANVNFLKGKNVTPDFISGYGGTGLIQKTSKDKASIILSDNKPSVFNCHIGLWHSSVDNVVWYKLINDEALNTLKKKVNVTTYNTYASMADLGVTTSSTALEMVKAMPHSSLYSGYVLNTFDRKLDNYGGMVDIKKSSNNLIAKISMVTANPNNMKKYEGIYNADVGDYITWKEIALTNA